MDKKEKTSDWIAIEGEYTWFKYDLIKAFNERKMRSYLIEYYTERNDECVDLECIVEANTIGEALQEFDKECKRITAITEVSKKPHSYLNDLHLEIDFLEKDNRILNYKIEQMYSEEDMREAFEWGVAHITFEEWIKQFKKK